MAYAKGMIAQLIEKFGSQGFTYKDAGVHFATLNAAVRRGLLSKDSKSFYHVEKKGIVFAQIEKMADSSEFFILRREGESLGKFCYLDGMTVMDCWDQPFDYENVFYQKVGDDREIFLS